MNKQQFHHYLEAEDIGMAVVKFQNGAVATIEGTTNVYPKNLEETLYLFGENGTVKLPDPYAVVCRSRPAGWDSVKPAESMPIMTDWKERFIEAYDIEFCKWVESVHAGKLTGPSSWDGYVACVAGDALNASRGTSQFLKVETMEKPEMYK